VSEPEVFLPTEVTLTSGGVLSILSEERTTWICVRGDKKACDCTYDMRKIWGVRYKPSEDETLVFLPRGQELYLGGNHIEFLTDWMVWL
jgi:hypothetical protein